MSELDRKIVRGSAWVALSYGGNQVILLIVTAVLARLLSPSEFGLVTLAGIAIVVLAAVQESGLGAAVVQRRGELEEAAATAFVFSLASSAVLCLVGFFVAPFVAEGFHQPRLTEVLRVLLLLLPLRAIGGIPGALIERELAFNRRARGELAGVALQAATSIPLAVLGAGVWALVAGQLVGTLARSVLYYLGTPLRPSPRRATLAMLRELGRYGRHVTAGNLVGIVDGNVDNIVAGRLLGSAGLAYYALAWRLCNLPATGLANIVGRVMFPAYATLQHDRSALREVFLTNLRRVALVSLPTALGILLAARPLVVGVFGTKWAPAVLPVEILAVFGLIRSFAGGTGSVFQASGRPQLVFLISSWHLVVLMIGLLTLGPSFGLGGVAGAVTIAAVSSLLPSYLMVMRILDLSLRELFANLLRPAAASSLLVLAMLALRAVTSGQTALLQLLATTLAGAIAYVAATLTFNVKELRTVRAAFRS